MGRSLKDLEKTSGVESTPKSKRAKLEGRKLDSNSESETEDVNDVDTPRMRETESSNRSSSNLESSVYDMSESSASEGDNSGDSDYGSKKIPKPKPQRAKKAARRRIEQGWEIVKTFGSDVAAEDYIENESSWVMDREVSSKEGLKTFYFCGLNTNKNCPAKAYMILPDIPGKISLFSNGKDHVHVPPKRGIPEAVKREIRRLQVGDINNVEEIMARLTTKNYPLPSHKQIKTFMGPKSSPKIRLPRTPSAPVKKQKSAEPSEAEGGSSKKRKRIRLDSSLDEE